MDAQNTVRQLNKKGNIRDQTFAHTAEIGWVGEKIVSGIKEIGKVRGAADRLL